MRKNIEQQLEQHYKQQENHGQDRIVYLVIAKPGGTIHFASYDKIEAEKHCDTWHKITPIVINAKTIKDNALAKLNPLDKLVLKL